MCIHTRRFAETCINIFLNENTNSTVAAVGTAWSLLGSPRNGQAALYLFQKHLLFGSTFIALVTMDGAALASNLVTTVQICSSLLSGSHYRDILPAPGFEIPAIRSAPASLASPPAAEISYPSALQRHLWNIVCDSSNCFKKNTIPNFMKIRQNF